ncbi:Protein DBF4-A [Galemys pyrenaicus]|uniref:Protein DBF4 homolog A n=1 Tax=Galemys pyrenaicus TaxID=202257 RepID=A0A8J5ZWP1_GALPY|nr:Protein DBF4-A [Galemys pyrenaicus]
MLGYHPHLSAPEVLPQPGDIDRVRGDSEKTTLRDSPHAELQAAASSPCLARSEAQSKPRRSRRISSHPDSPPVGNKGTWSRRRLVGRRSGQPWKAGMTLVAGWTVLWRKLHPLRLVNKEPRRMTRAAQGRGAAGGENRSEAKRAWKRAHSFVLRLFLLGALKPAPETWPTDAASPLARCRNLRKGRRGGIQVKNEKNRPSLKSVKTDNKPEKSKYKPLWGKVFYIDLPSVTISEKLQKDIKDLGGRVEEFLSKDISYLISNKKEAKFAQTLGRISPIPSPESAYTVETTSPHPSHDGSSFKPPDSVCLSRGKLLVEKAIKDHDFIPSNSILSNALSWGVKILHIDDIRYYIEQKKKELYLLKKSSTSVRDVGKRVGIGTQKARTGRLKKPFVKVEDISQISCIFCYSFRFYRPFYLQLTNMPFINYSVQKPTSPFDVDKPSSSQKQTQVKLRIQADGDKCGGNPVQLQLKEKKKKGYCECCLQKYEDLETHLLGQQHRNFAQSNRYQIVDDIVSKLVFDFVEYERDMPKKKRIKYSIGSLSPVTSNLKKMETKEMQEVQHISQKDLRENNVQVITEQSLQYKETQKPEEKLVFISEPISYHLTANKCSMLSPVEDDKNQIFTHIPPHKNKEEWARDIPEHKLIINENDLEELRIDHCPCRQQTSINVSNFNTDSSVSQLKQKSDNILFPTKDLKEKDLHSVCGHDSHLLAINNSQDHLLIQAETPLQSPPEEPNECDIKNMDSLPFGKIHRKVKILLGRNKKENMEPNVELNKKRTEILITPEENKICSSSVQSLLDLFQTSEEKSEFLGFTSYTENSAICDALDIWEEENSNNLLSMFFSSPSASTFTGF